MLPERVAKAMFCRTAIELGCSHERTGRLGLPEREARGHRRVRAMVLQLCPGQRQHMAVPGQRTGGRNEVGDHRPMARLTHLQVPAGLPRTLIVSARTWNGSPPAGVR